MHRLMVLTALLLCFSAGAQVHSGPLRVAEVTTQIAESTRLKMLAAAARGDIQGAIALWQIHTGQQNIPAWLRAFQTAFSAENQKAGPCIDVAKRVFEGFRKLGGDPTYLKFTSEGSQRGANLLGFEMRAGDSRSTVQISENFVHFAVRLDNRIYDAFTGPRGLEMGEYMRRLVSPGSITSQVVSELP
jgi:hypothetical protein